MADWTTIRPSTRATAKPQGRAFEAYAAVAAAGMALLLAMALVLPSSTVDARAIIVALTIFAIISAVVFSSLDMHGHQRFGAANVVTTGRAAITAMIGGLVLTSEQLGQQLGTETVPPLAVATGLALALDGIDGYLARRSGTASRFGARFDMEVDALLILFLSVAAYSLEKAGIWVILIGSMRYAHLAAQAMLPPLRGDLYPSRRRKLVCVIQGAALCVMLFPAIVPPFSILLAAVALVSLAWSFAVDVLFLLRKNRSPHAA